MVIGEDSGSRKIYYTVGEVADEIGVKPHRIRYWSDEVKEIDPKTTPGGNRQFTEDHVEMFKVLHRLVEEQQYTLDGARRKLNERDQRGGTEGTRRSIIEECEEGLREINEWVDSM